MKLLQGERVLLESDNQELVLTTHRVRFETEKSGSATIISIMLEEISSCQISHATTPILFWLALASALLGVFLFAQGGGRQPGTGAIVVAIVLAILYAATRRGVISFTSPETVLRVATKGMELDVCRQLIDATEAAKNERFLQRH